MSADENKAFIRRYFDAISGKEKPAAVVDQYVADSDQALTATCLWRIRASIRSSNCVSRMGSL